MVGAEPARIEDSGGVPGRVWWEVEEVGHWGDDGSNLTVTIGRGIMYGADRYVS